MKTLYLNLLFYTACCLLLFSSCEIKDNTPCAAQYTYHHLTAEEKSKTPYFNNPNFDTISFASSTGDTLTFALQRIDSSWYIEDMNRNPNPDGCPDWHYYETIAAKYVAIKGSGRLTCNLFKKSSSRIIPAVSYSLNDKTGSCSLSVIGLTAYVDYVGTKNINGIDYYDVLFVENDFISKSIRVYMNQSYGLLQIEDTENEFKYSLITH